MARALWKGAISFGLVNVPVEMIAAENRKAFRFAMLDKRDLSPVGYKRFSKASGREVPWADIVKGYEYEKDRYVVLSDEDFRQANVRATQTIDIRAFVPGDEIPPEYYETPYWLAPAPRGEKVYALLRDTLADAGRVAVAEVVIRTTQHLVAVLAHERALQLVTLRYPDELVDAKKLELPAAGAKQAASPKEVELARRLVDDMTEPFDPSKYADTYHEDLMKRVEAKIEAGKTAEITPAARRGAGQASIGAKVIDLAELLRRSLDRKPARAHGNGNGSGAATHDGVEGAKRRAAPRARSPSTQGGARRAKRPATHPRTAHAETAAARRKRA